MKNTRIIKSNRDFRRLYSCGESAAGGFIVAYRQPNRRGYNRVGFTVSKHLGNAVTRNRTKRLMRESYRLLEDRLTGFSDLVIVARNRAAGKSYARISRDMEYVFSTLGLLGGKDGNDKENIDFVN